MFAGKIVLVLGAGSSLDFGMPLGSGLAREILNYSNIEGVGIRR